MVGETLELVSFLCGKIQLGQVQPEIAPAVGAPGVCSLAPGFLASVQ